MMFDFQTIAIVCLFVVVSAALLLFISVVVTKEKTYEEAIAEQRQQTNALLATQTKQKPKEKKQKKAGKKVKEKTSPPPTDHEAEEPDVTEPPAEAASAAPQPPSHPKHHVEFKEPAALDEPPKDVNKRRSKRDKVRPILLNRDMSEEKIVLTECEVEPANRFEELHPKDEFELLHYSHSKDNSPKREAAAKEKPAKEKLNAQEVPVKAKKVAKLQTAETTTQTNPIKEDVPVQQVTQITQTNGLVMNTGKEKKKKKTEQNIIEQLTADKDGLNLQLLTSLVRKAELSRSEVQILIDMLLNKQHEAPTIIDEWSEGKADPVQKLKRQLAEKEKLLAEEQEALLSAQAKLKEVRGEQLAEKSQLQQKLRGLEEALNAKHLELQGVNSRLVGTQQKLQPLQEQLNGEMLKSHKLMEENGAYQMQIQQMNLIISQAQEKEIASSEHQQNILAQLQHQNALLKNDLDQKDDYIRKIEDAHKELEHRCNIMQRQENDLQVEVSQLNTSCQQQREEIQMCELNKVQMLGELQNMKKCQEEYEKIVSQLKSDLLKVEEEKRQYEVSRENGVLEEKKAHQVEMKNLQNELSSLKLQLQENEQKYNTSLDATVTQLRTELEEQKEKNNDLRKKNWKVMEALNQAENRNKTLSSRQTIDNLEEAISKVRTEEQSLNKNFIRRLFPDVTIDDDLPHGEWCTRIEGAVRSYISDLRRPATPVPADDAELVKLQNEIRHYKVIIDDTEGMLNKLQNHVEQEEIQWRKQLDVKDKELESFKSQSRQEGSLAAGEAQGVEFAYKCIEKSLPMIVNELQEKLAEVQKQVELEKEKQQKLSNENNTLKSVHIERLREDIRNLSVQLDESQKRNDELQVQLDSMSNLAVKAINHSNTSNGPAVTVENNNGN